MIQHEKTDSGGSVRVKSKNGIATVFFSHYDTETPMSLMCSVKTGSNPSIARSVVETLCERYSPVVLMLESEQTEIRYVPKIQSMFRCWTYGKQSVFAEAFSSREMFGKICSLSYAMQNTDFVLAEDERLNLYGYHKVLSKIRQKHSPFEFMAIKEECDHHVKRTAAECVDTILASAVSVLPQVRGKLQERFETAISEISKRQTKETGFDTRYSYIQEATTAILLPAVVLLGGAHPFTQVVFSEFSDSAAKYISVCSNFISEYCEIKSL